MLRFSLLVPILSLYFALANMAGAIAQITSANDHTGTVVTPISSDFEITGGTTSGDGSNLFHHFNDFNLEASESATFATEAAIANILSRVSGGNPSYIDGLLQVVGSDANLFLLNPQGIILGENAQLNLPADFTASTATGLGFSDGEWQLDTEDFSALTGEPNQFFFNSDSAIINAADLTLNAGRSLNLFSNNVTNLGNITVPEGHIQLVAVPGSQTLRLSQTGHLLSLELDATNAPIGNLTATNLPELLTGNVDIPTGLTLQAEKPFHTATQTAIAPDSGNLFIAKSLDVSGNVGGEISAFGQNIQVINAELNATGANGGGDITIGGNFQGEGDRPRASQTFINANSTLDASASDFGDGGEVIVWSDDRTDFDGSLFTKGGKKGGNGGFAEISSKNVLDLAPGWSGRVSVKSYGGKKGQLLLDPTDIRIVDGFASGTPITSPESGSLLTDIDIQNFLDDSGDLTIATADTGNELGNITIEEDVQIFWFDDSSLILEADNDIIVDESVLIFGRAVSFSADKVLRFEAGNDINHAGSIGGANMDVEFIAGGNITGGGDLSSNGSDLTIEAPTGSIELGRISGQTPFLGEAGTVTVLASGDITLESVSTQSLDSGGDIDIRSTNGLVRVTGNVSGFATSDGDRPSIDARGCLPFNNTQRPEQDELLLASKNLGQTQLGQITTPSKLLAAIAESTEPLQNSLHLEELHLAQLDDLGGCTGGQVRNGEIYIFHTGAEETPFVVGNATENGTAGVITTGDSEILVVESFPETEERGNITIETRSPEPEIPEPEEPTPDVIDCFPDCAKETTSGENVPTGEPLDSSLEIEQITLKLEKIHEQTGVNPALIYVFFNEESGDAVQAMADTKSSTLKDQKATDFESIQWQFKGDRLTDFINAATRNYLNPRPVLDGKDELELVMVTYNGNIIRKKLPDVTRAEVMDEVSNFVGGVTNPRLSDSYLAPAQNLYRVLLEPLKADLEKEQINNLTYIMDDGLRVLPLAALHDGEKFVIEDYSLGLMPSFSLTNTTGYVKPGDNQLLAMGASEFANQDDLPAAPLEVQIIADQIWDGDTFVENQFTVDNLLAARDRTPYGIVHLATHGQFRSGSPEESYVQFQNEKIALEDLEELQLNEPPIELLVLSACRTAIGDRQAELGFSGLALASGAKAAIGSIWYVSDAGTMGLMTRLYEDLQTAPIKAEALRTAQLSLMRGEVRLENGQLITQNNQISLPAELGNVENIDLSHPFFWSGFALVGNPW